MQLKMLLKKRLIKTILLLSIVTGLFAAPGLNAFAAGNSSGSLVYGTAKSLAPGVTYQPFTYTNWANENVTGHVVEITPGGELLELRPALGNDALGGRETVSSLAQRHGAVAAVNAGFFDGGTGNPIGGLVVDGVIQYKLDVLRTSIGWTGKGTFDFGYVTPAAKVVSGNTVIEINEFNRLPQPGQVALITPLSNYNYYSITNDMLAIPITKKAADTYEISGTVGSRDEYLLVFGQERMNQGANLQTGAKVTINFELGAGLTGVEHLVTGGPLLVQDGIPVFQAVNEGFRGSVLLPNTRTAVGVKANGNVLLVVVEKNASSPGLTLDELAWLMVKLDSVRAAGLDGGGSTTMWAGDKLVSKPLDASERKVANALLVLYQIPTYLDGKRVYFDVSPFIERGRTLVPLRGIFELLDATVGWDQKTQTVTATRDTRSIKLTIGQNKAMVGDNQVVLDVAPQVVNNRTMVPLRFIGEALGAKVDWQNQPKAVYITSPGEEF